ncbi:MAG: M48 family metalloprotease [Cyanobacteria bacterium]|nr:M48 family metalloprotease [Cyanobacteriota bacterium]
MTFAIAAILIAGILHTAPQAQQAPAPASGATTMTVDVLAQKIMEAESGVTARMSSYKPLVEVYVQYVEPHAQLGTVPIKDDYFLGQFESSPQGPRINSFTAERTTTTRRLPLPFAASALKLDGFAAMTVPDWKLLNNKKYNFTFLRREFLGEVRCLVLDVAPRVTSTDGFTGRIWVEDRDFNIVRFNGIIRGLSSGAQSGKKFWFNVDSWRANVKPGLWLPSHVYSEQHSDTGPTLKSQMRLWGYDLRSTKPVQEFTTITIDEPSVRDNTEQPQQLSPTLSQRLWEQQAEENVLDRLTKAGLLAPPGEVDKVLETVATNLQITNNLTMDPVKARVLLTSPIESFTVGRTIVLSRGLIDVLPDEASLATMLGHELAHIVLGHRVIDTKFAFADKLMVPDDELLATVAYRHDPKDEEAADWKVGELLKNSPYKDKLAEAGLFLRALSENSLKLKNLIQPHIGENSSSQVELLRAATLPLASAREKSSMAVTPLVPYLRYAEPKTTPTPKNRERGTGNRDPKKFPSCAQVRCQLRRTVRQ